MKSVRTNIENAQPIAELFAEHLVLRLQIVDDVLLTAIHPSGEDREQELKMRRVHPRQRTPTRVSAGPRTTTAPPFSMMKLLTFRVGRLLAHYGMRMHMQMSTDMVALASQHKDVREHMMRGRRRPDGEQGDSE